MDSTQPLSQEQQILSYFKKGHRLTSLEALAKFGCMRLGARVWTLKRKGWPIQREMIKTTTGKTVADYWMEIN